MHNCRTQPDHADLAASKIIWYRRADTGEEGRGGDEVCNCWGRPAPGKAGPVAETKSKRQRRARRGEEERTGEANATRNPHTSRSGRTRTCG